MDYLLNQAFRFCLSSEGVAPYDLVNSSGSTVESIPNNQYEFSAPTPDYAGEFKQKQQAQCQEQINTYNLCMNTYNQQLGEYNTCLSESNNPNSWRYGYSCFEPFNSCYKPVCAF